MAVVKSARQTTKGKRGKATPKIGKSGAPRTRGAKRIRIAGGSGRIPDEILETPGPACPGAVELLIADRNR
jgi:hypothetical protein